MSPAAPSPPGEPEPQAAATGPAEPSRFQDLAAFRLPPGFHGRPAWFVQLWWAVQASLFARSPRIAYGWRRFLLRLFGARIGRAVLIRPSARCIYPWRLAIGDRSWIGEQVELYTLAPITIGKDVVVSQRTRVGPSTGPPVRPRSGRRARGKGTRRPARIDAERARVGLDRQACRCCRPPVPPARCSGPTSRATAGPPPPPGACPGEARCHRRTAPPEAAGRPIAPPSATVAVGRRLRVAVPRPGHRLPRVRVGKRSRGAADPVPERALPKAIGGDRPARRDLRCGSPDRRPRAPPRASLPRSSGAGRPCATAPLR